MDCKHRWVIGKVDGDVWPAECKKCRARRTFPTYTPISKGSLRSAPREMRKDLAATS